MYKEKAAFAAESHIKSHYIFFYNKSVPSSLLIMMIKRYFLHIVRSLLEILPFGL